jgi:hypothetical protein
MVLVLKRCCYIMVDPKTHVLENGVGIKMCHEKIHQNARPSQKKAKINFCIVSRVGNFRQKSYSAEDGIDETILVRSGGILAAFRLFRGTEISRNSVPNHSVEEKNAWNSVQWNKNRSRLLEFRGREKMLGIPFGITKIEANSRDSVPNPSAEEKTTRNSVPWNKNTSKLSEFRFEAFDNF